MTALGPESTGLEVRSACRRNAHVGPTAGLAIKFAQANLVILPADTADEFRAFCQSNAQPCPLMEVLSVGSYTPRDTAEDADLRTDLPRYRILQQGSCVDRPHEIAGVWRDDFVSFLLGCSFTFEAALVAAGLPVRHVEEGRNVPMYRTNRMCHPAGRFAGRLVVSMRPMSPEQARLATTVTSPMEHAHGAPIHVGDADALGIADLARPDYGDAVSIGPDEVPVFWACGVTPMEALLRAKLEIAITHEPGHMFVTDVGSA